MTPSEKPGGLTRIAQVYSTTEAMLIIAAMEAANFQVFVPGFQIHNTAPHLAVALGGIPVMVPDAQAEEAALFLSALESDDPGEAPQNRIAKPPRPLWLSLMIAAAYMFTGTAPPVGGRFMGPHAD